MRGDLPANHEKVWRSGLYIGNDRPMGRVTVQHPQMRLFTYALQSTFRRVPLVTGDVPSFNPYPSGIDPTHGEPITNTYADYLFGAPNPPRELPNVTSIQWDRSTDTMTASATISFWNVAPLPIGEVPANGDLDRPGFYTYNRGTAAFSSRWGHTTNQWQNMLVPDNLLRTYEGYGTDNPRGAWVGSEDYVPPESDTHLRLTGVWSIDEVRLSALGTLTCTCRDAGKLFQEQLAFIPVVPNDFYPATFRDWGDKVTVQQQRTVITDVTRVDRLPVVPLGSGNDLWPESAYTGARVYGHTHTNAFDNVPGSYWLSVGNVSPGKRFAYEYVDFDCRGATVSQVRFTTVKDGYNAFVSVKVGGSWVPGPIVGYHRDGAGHYEEGVPYVASKGALAGEGEHVISFDPIANVSTVRLWLHNLQNFGLPGDKYRAALREVAAYGPVRHQESNVVTDVNQVALTPGPAGANPGRCLDYSDIVKLFAAWAGLFWPVDAMVWSSDGSQQLLAPAHPDYDVLGAGVMGRVWADIQTVGTAPVAQIVASAFDQKSLADGLQYVCEALGFIAYFDETGALQFRLPNYYSLGSWIGGVASNPGRTRNVWVIDERQVLMGLDAVVQSRSVREGVFVGNPVGKFAALVAGYNPNDTGLRRVAGYSDANFASSEEARVMADLIAVRQLFKYRQDVIQIPGFLGLQIDDQVRIFERVTSEGFIHYVKGISSRNDLASGQWTYDVSTHWLGDDPDGRWVLDMSTLHSTTAAYVDALQSGAQWDRAGLGL